MTQSNRAPGEPPASAEHAIRIGQAIAAHEQWKASLGEAIRAGTSTLDPVVTARDDRCELGRWLHDLEHTGAATDAGFQSIVAEHRRFHEHAARILRMATDGRRAAALRALEGEYAAISAELESLLRAWRAL